MSFEGCRALRPARVLKVAALGAVIAVSLSTAAAAQQGNAYGLGRPAAVDNLPAGPFRTALKALPAQARGRAMAVLQGGEFTEGDLPYLRVAEKHCDISETTRTPSGNRASHWRNSSTESSSCQRLMRLFRRLPLFTWP